MAHSRAAAASLSHRRSRPRLTCNTLHRWASDQLHMADSHVLVDAAHHAEFRYELAQMELDALSVNSAEHVRKQQEVTVLRKLHEAAAARLLRIPASGAQSIPSTPSDSASSPISGRPGSGGGSSSTGTISDSAASATRNLVPSPSFPPPSNSRPAAARRSSVWPVDDGRPSAALDDVAAQRDSLTSEPQQQRKRRKYKGHKSTTAAATTKAEERRRWLYDGHCRGDRQRPLVHKQALSPFYHHSIDAEAGDDSGFRAVPDEYAERQPEVVTWFTVVLQTHAAKVAADSALLSQRRLHAAKKKRRNSPSSVDVPHVASRLDGLSDGVALSASGGEESDSERDSDGDSNGDHDGISRATAAAAQHGALNASRGTGVAAVSRNRKRRAAAVDSTVNSDWDDDARQRPSPAATDALHQSTDPRRLMTDVLYLLLIEILIDPAARLRRLRLEQPEVFKAVKRALLFRHRYMLHWSRVEVQHESGVPAGKHTRVVPMLFSVAGSCKSDSPTLDLCRRVVPLSQVGVLLNSVHCRGGHMKDQYATLREEYCCIPRKAVRVWATMCQGCARVERRPRNRRAPVAIVVDDVRQRFVLDLVDMKEWQRTSTGDGKKARYMAHMIDHSSKKRWTRGIKDKTANEVRLFVQHVFTENGHPALLHTDNGREFANHELEDECRLFGTYIVHGRPYHPQAQGAVERPNGVQQRAMQAFRNDHPHMTDWVHIMHEVTRMHNDMIHSVTGLKPERHFAEHNNAPRQRTPLLPTERCVITVAEVERMEKLRWVRPCVLGDPTSGHGGAAASTPSTAAVSRAGDSTIMPTPVVEAAMATADTSETDCAALAVVGNAAAARVNAAPTATAAPTASAVASALQGLRILQPGDRQPFDESDVDAWTRKFGHEMVDLLQLEGTIAQGDCGPAAGFRATSDDRRAATVSEALQVRGHVIDYGRSKNGAAYYAGCREAAEQQPGELHVVLRDEAAPQRVVSFDWFTLYGGRYGLNVFVFIKLINLVAADGDKVTFGIQLVTNGGTMVSSDDDNTVAFYYQGIKRTAEGAVSGHWETVCARRDNNSTVWNHKHPVVADCLLKCMQQQHLRDTRIASIKKQVRAADCRTEARNETLVAGDCVWLKPPPKLMAAVKSKLRAHDDKRNCEGKMLCKVVQVQHSDSSTGIGKHVSYQLLSLAGVLASWFTIDHLARCYPPPADEPVTSMSLSVDQSGRKHKTGIKLPAALKAYAKLRSTRAAGTAARLSSSQPQRSAPVTAEHNKQQLMADLALCITTINQDELSSEVSWLTDDAINIAGCVLNLGCFDAPHHDVYCFNPLAIKQCRDKGRLLSELPVHHPTAQRASDLTCRYWALPCNINNAHWLLCVYDRTGRVVYVADSQSRSNDAAFVPRDLVRVLGFDADESVSCNRLPVPRQEDSWSCGLFVVESMRIVVQHGVHSTRFQSISVDGTRALLLQWIDRFARHTAASTAQPAAPTAAAVGGIPTPAVASQTASASTSAFRAEVPCVLCKRTRTFAQRSSCARAACSAPLCMTASGCSGRVQAVDGLLYCRPACARQDRPPKDSATRARRVASQPTSSPASTTASSTVLPLTQPSTSCKTCWAALPVAARRATCDVCGAYVCKLGKRQSEGCVRPGWSQPGTGRLDGLLRCIECRFSDVQRRRPFNE